MGVIRERIASEISYYLTRLPNGANQPTPHNMLEASLRSMRLWLCACVLLFDHCYFENVNVCCAEIKSLKIGKRRAAYVSNDSMTSLLLTSYSVLHRCLTCY